MAKPLENPVYAEETRQVLQVSRWQIPLNAPLTPGLVISGATSPNFNGGYLLESTLINGRPWLSDGVYDIKSDAEGFYTIDAPSGSANHWKSTEPHAEPWNISSWEAVGTVTGSIQSQKVYGLTVEAEPNREAYYRDRRWVKLTTAGWQEFHDSSRTLEAHEGQPKDQGIGFTVGGTIPEFAKGLIVSAGTFVNSDGRVGFSDTGSSESGEYTKGLYFDSLFNYWIYQCKFDSVIYSWFYNGDDSDTSAINSWTWQPLGIEEGIPEFDAYNEIGTPSKLGEPWIYQESPLATKVYICVSQNPLRFQLLQSKNLVENIINNILVNSNYVSYKDQIKEDSEKEIARNNISALSSNYKIFNITDDQLTIGAEHLSSYIRCNNSSGLEVTIPDDPDFPIGSFFEGRAFLNTIQFTSGNIVSSSGPECVSGMHFKIWKISETTWELVTYGYQSA